MVANIVRSQDQKTGRAITSPQFGQGEVRERPLDKSTVAEIPSGLISRMSREELIRVIQAAELPLLNARTRERLPYLDRMVLERLAHLARRCCRNQGY